MKITVVVESIYVGPAAGFVQIVVNDGDPVQEIIKKFCEIKGTTVDPLYAIINDANVNFDGRKLISDYHVQDNDRLKLGRRREPASMFLFVNWFRVSILGTLAGVLGLVGVALLYIFLRETPLKYGIVLDAGSTHTEVTLYSWPGEKFRNTGRVSEVSACNIPKPGIADVSPENVSTYLQTCISNVTSHIPPQFVAETQIFFGATAGMRVLMEEDPIMAWSVLNETRKVLRKTGFLYSDDDAIIISGEKEGLAGWISVNFLKNSFKGVNQNVSDEVLTYGSLDMGGASMQIAVEVENSSRNTLHADDESLVTLFDHNYTVYTESFLCYGSLQALNRYRSLLLLSHDPKSGSNVSSPCEPDGFSYTLKLSQIFVFPCAKMPVNSSLHGLKKDATFYFRGSSNLEQCVGMTKQLVQPEVCDQLGSAHCISHSFPREISFKKFLAYSTFGHIIENLNMSSVGALEIFKSKINRTCLLDYNILDFAHNTFKIQIPLKRLESLCFGGQYVLSVMTEVFGFTTTEDWRRVEFGTKVGGISLSWPLGLMLNATVYTPVRSSESEMNSSTFIILIVVFGLISMLGCMFFYHAFKLRKDTAYERLSFVM